MQKLQSNKLIRETLPNILKNFKLKNLLDNILMKLIFVQHRSATLLNCDRIIVFDEGKIIEEGSPADLMQRQNGVFLAMIKAAEQSGEQRWKNNQLTLLIYSIDVR